MLTRKKYKSAVGSSKSKFRKFYNDEKSAIFKYFLEKASDKRPNWTLQNKAYALIFFKRCPQSHRFLHSFVKLPVPSNLRECFKSIPFNAGIEEH